MIEIKKGQFTGAPSGWGIMDYETDTFYNHEDIGKVIYHDIFPKLVPHKKYRIKITAEVTEIKDDSDG